MCMQCVRADRREAEGRPARWQRRQARVLWAPFPLPDFSGLERALHEMATTAERRLLMMRETQGTLSRTAPTPAQLARAADVTPYIRDVRIGRGA